ncbi:hypothetical protein JTE90_019920 [Oedothorax gibbosus]|uniref:PX domain-containing protein n=1 Tax=Oedothorax gibbosus TaxID=931172 RepID=A0AAV6US91_9ARAC|nr:hypothetical protein JTE90_019920 [Oedothorax gibbosus]
MDNHSYMTIVSVHTPLIQFSSTGSYYTSYAISLKSNNPCFTHAYSQIRRRYSEFHHLRILLVEHYPNVSKPPLLPPKSYFHRFSDKFIEERKIGLQKFLEQVLDIPVFLSDKGLHLFLQSSLSMAQIDEQCHGDIPVPQLMDEKMMNTQFPCELSTSSGSSDKVNVNPSGKVKPSGKALLSERDRSFLPSNKPAANRTLESLKELDYDEVDSDESGYSSPTPQKAESIQKTHVCKSSEPCLIPRGNCSWNSSPCSSTSSLDTSYTTQLEQNRTRRVSFNENVTVAVVYNDLWNINIRPMRTSL